MRRRIIFLVLITLLVSMSLIAQTTGRIAGRVRDQDGEAIAYASVSIPELGTGAQTDDKGTYIIINVPPGTYDVVCQMMGYQPQRNSGVVVNVNEATVLNMTLTRTAVEMETFQVIDQKEERVSAQKTSSGGTINAEAMEDFTVTDISDIVAVQAGVSMVDGEIHVRGGRANEVQYTIDGMSVSDPVDGGNALSIDTDAIEVTNVMTGGFPAEFGNAQSGIINIVTKSGDESYSGKLEFITDHIIAENDSNSDEIKFAIGGPLLTPAFSNLRNKLTFFMNGGGNWYDTRYKDFYKSNPKEELVYLISEDFPSYDPYDGRDAVLGFDVGQNRNFNDYQINFKTKYQFNPFRNLTFAIRADRNIYNPYFHTWKYALAHTPEIETEQQQYILTYDHTFNPRMNLKVKGSVYQKQNLQMPKGVPRDNYFWINDSWENWENEWDGTNQNKYNFMTANLSIEDHDMIDFFTPDGIIQDDIADIPWVYLEDGNEVSVGEFVRPGTIWPNFIDDENATYSFRADFEYQLNLVHNFKTGLEIIKHYIKKDQKVSPWNFDNNRFTRYLNNVEPLFSFDAGDVFEYTLPNGEVYVKEFNVYTPFYSPEQYYNAFTLASGEVDGYEANPWQAAYYLQDSMQWEGLNVNAGLRFDFWYLNKSYDKFQNDGSIEVIEFDKSDRFQVMVSPRLGVSHPISETTVMHFAYNYQNQLPQMQYIFTSKSPEDAITSDDPNVNVIIGNATLEPQITVTYEVGLQKQLGEYYVMDVATYYKNIYNYVNTQKVFYQIGTQELVPYSEFDDNLHSADTPMYQYISEDYGSAKGINLNLQRLLSNFVSASTSYSLAWAQGNNSDAVLQDEATSLREFALDWDIRHEFSFNFTFRVGKYEEWYLPMTDVLFPFDDFSMNFSYDISSGKPYTPRTEREVLETNSERMKPYELAGLRITKRFSFGESTSMRIYMNIRNLFNRRNELFVYPMTGSPYYDGQDLSSSDSDYVPEARQYIHDLATKHPANVSNGRTYSFGISFNW